MNIKIDVDLSKLELNELERLSEQLKRYQIDITEEINSKTYIKGRLILHQNDKTEVCDEEYYFINEAEDTLIEFNTNNLDAIFDELELLGWKYMYSETGELEFYFLKRIIESSKYEKEKHFKKRNYKNAIHKKGRLYYEDGSSIWFGDKMLDDTSDHIGYTFYDYETGEKKVLGQIFSEALKNVLELKWQIVSCYDDVIIFKKLVDKKDVL